MAASRRRFSALEDFCMNVETGDEALPEFFHLLRGYVDSDHAAYFHADEHGRICGAYHEVPQHTPHATEFIRRARAGTDARRAQDPPSVAQMFRMPVPLQHISFDGLAARESALYRDVIGPIGGRHVLRVGLRIGGRPAGFIALVRGRTARGFTETERLRALHAARPLRRLLRRSAAEDERILASEGFLLVSRDGVVMDGSEEGWRLWELVQDRRFLPAPDRDSLLPSLLDDVSKGAPTGEFARSLRTGWGKFELIVVPLHGAERGTRREMFLVRLQRWVLARILYLRRMTELAFSSMQKLVCIDLLRGRTQSEIAADHGIGVQTAITHIRGVYSKAGVANRSELLQAFRCATSPPTPRA